MWCVVCGVVVFCASFGFAGVGLWTDDSPRLPKKKASAKIQGKGLNVPGNLEKAHGDHRKVSKESTRSHRFTC